MTPATLVIVNPASASGRTKDRWQGIVDDLRSQGVDAEATLTAGPEDATRIAREHVRAGVRDIVVLGGDGTVGETVAGLVREDGTGVEADGITLAVIHQGTGGDYARGLGIPRDASDAVRVAATGRRTEVDVPVATYANTGLIRGFASMANIGMGADVCREVSGNLKRLGNSGAFAISAVHQILRNRPRGVRITSPRDSFDLDIVDVMVGNSRYMGGGMLAAPHALMDDGELDVIMVCAAPRLRLVSKFPKIYKGTHLEDPIARWFRSSELSIEATGDQQGVVLDGELVGTTPVSFHVLPRAIGVRVP